ncbi:hypothetical protein PIB30_005477 [Stylosanthes scabra]|uniref:F-box protein n=1 Tax=Stylosanthes scabra TaxID=79078 RepID=A0ABU6Z3Q1_9FABA|nr:hypothetical protein [Stylosanthes scabra]
MSSETFVTTSIDQCNNSDAFRVRCLMVLKESVAVVSMFPEKDCFEISILGEVGVKESWVKLFTVGLLPSVEYPIGAGKNGDIFFTKKDSELVWYDFSSKMFKEVGMKGECSYSQTVML